jgi:DNA-directed RNA polymerase alpha subunit
MYDNVPIEALDLPVRPYNALVRYGITTIGEVLEWLRSDIPEAIRGFDEKGVDEIIARLKAKGYLSDDDALGAPPPTQ